jgi:hypothetical protein
MSFRTHTRTVAAVMCLGLGALLPISGSAAAPPQAAKVAQLDSTTVLQEMAGTWNVRQRMWTGPDSAPVPLPAATARRRFVHGAYLQEDMTLAAGTDGDPFTRHAVLSRNAVNQTFEYFSIDSRLPQMMMYPTGAERRGGLWFTLPAPFVAPAWGEDADVPFKARLQVQPGRDRQVVRLYLRRLSAQPTEEFLAFEYIYTRAG